MNIEEAKAMPLPEILRKLGYLPVKQRGNELLYFSPLRRERTPSFNVNTEKNVWYDFGRSDGGNVLKFVTAYLFCQGEDNTVADALRWCNNMNGAVNVDFQIPAAPEGEEASTLSIRQTRQLAHKGLVNYIEGRGISLELARKHVEEGTIFNSKSGKEFQALCWKNESGGYEVRNEYFKGCIAAKGITFIRGKEIPAKEIHLFEGMLDYLSVLEEKGKQFRGDAIVLNSVACVPQALAYIKTYPYEKLSTWFDKDAGGVLATKTLKEFAEKTGAVRFQGKNNTYAKFKDPNDWHMSRRAAAPVPR